jgi:hypothetical protein
MPVLNDCVLKLFIPVATDEPLVAPDIAHVKVVTEQLSLYVGFGVATLALHEPAATGEAILAGQVKVGSMLSFIVTVKEQVAVLLAASFAV